MKEYLIKEETLKGIADAIREKGSTTGSIKVGNMIESIKGLPENNQNKLYEKVIGRAVEWYGNSWW